MPPQVEATQPTSSHMMKTTKRGRPFLKVCTPRTCLHPYLTIIPIPSRTRWTCSQRSSSPWSLPRTGNISAVFLTLSPRTCPLYRLSMILSSCWTPSDDAARNLASLKFSQSNRGPDPRESSRIVTTTTTTTFSMTRDMAKAMCQQFMDARLIENAADPGSNLFKERGVYVLTPKGLHVLERFMSKNGINGDHLARVFSSQPICMKLLHLERRSVDDEIIVSHSAITALFRRFVGRSPNSSTEYMDNADAFQKYHERSKGVALMDVSEKTLGKTPAAHKYCFAAVTALEWLCDFTSVIGREEAAEMCAQFVRFGLITLVSDKRKNNDSAIIFTVRGAAGGANSSISVRWRLHGFHRLCLTVHCSNTESSAARRKPFTVLPMRVVDSLVGTCQMVYGHHRITPPPTSRAQRGRRTTIASTHLPPRDPSRTMRRFIAGSR